MKVEYSKKVLNFFCISELEKWRNLRKFLSFFHSHFFQTFALRNNSCSTHKSDSDHILTLNLFHKF